MPWGTFTLDPTIKARVQQKISSGQPLDIPVFTWIQGDDFFTPVKKGIAAAAAKYHTTSTLIGPLASNQPEEIADIQSYLIRKPDAIAITLANNDDGQALINRLLAQGLPVLIWNSDAPKTKRLAYVGQDNTKAGAAVGALMVKKLQAKGVTSGKIAMFATDATAAYSKDQRFPGFRNAVKAALPNIQFMDPVTLGPDISAAVGHVDATVRGKSGIVGMYSADEIVVALATWEKQNAKKGDYVIVGHNILPTELQLISAGYIDGTVGQDPYHQGYNSVQWLYNFLKTGKTDCGPICDTGYPVVDNPAAATNLLAANCGGQGCG
jgi:simple sugar transport system substrate-binding protein/ribose transport system substrate-binding protein